MAARYGATANSFAWVGASHPGLHEPESYFLLNALGVQAYRRLEVEYDLRPWFARTGCLTWSTHPAEQEATVKNASYLSDRGYNAVLLTPGRAAQLEPAAALPEWCPGRCVLSERGVGPRPAVRRADPVACARRRGEGCGWRARGRVRRGGRPSFGGAVRIGVRALPGDEMPVVGRIPGHDNVYVCTTHSGVTLAPLLAELTADLSSASRAVGVVAARDFADEALLRFPPGRWGRRPIRAGPRRHLIGTIFRWLSLWLSHTWSKF